MRRLKVLICKNECLTFCMFLNGHLFHKWINCFSLMCAFPPIPFKFESWVSYLLWWHFLWN